MERGRLVLDDLEYVVLDEADQMLNMVDEQPLLQPLSVLCVCRGLPRTSRRSSRA